jgi:acyl transferase domain-containing protein
MKITEERTMSTQRKQQAASKTAHNTPVAIVGMAGIFPQAENLERYWMNILQEVNCITEVPTSRWSVEDYYDPDPNTPDKTYSKHGGFIPDIQFDPMEFGLPPNFLEVTDVSQLLGLVVARDALADAGYPEKGKEVFDRTGVVLGMVGMSSKVIQPLLNRLQYPVWEKVLRSSSVPDEEIPAIIEKIKLAYVGWNENAFPGAIGNVVAGRIANRFDLGGTNCIVDAACGSSLAAVNMAINELSLGRADMMITGGVDTDNSVLTFLCFSKTPAFSKGNRLQAFSEGSDGMLAGEGIGMLVLKRLADAERDGDRIYAVVRGVGTSSDGYFKSIYAPRPSGQAKAIERAYSDAGYSFKTVGLIEAHGTGTNAGDPAEFEGLREVFSRDNPQTQYIALGSVKSQIGHTKATAGAASMIKAALALHHKVLPATINVSKPNPAMEIEKTPFYLNTHTRPWFKRTDGEPRRAGVSSFGFGGTNFHIAVEEYTHDNQSFNRIQPTPYTILLSAPSLDELKGVCQTTLKELSGDQAPAALNRLDESSYSVTIPVNHHRIGFVAESIEDASEKLTEAARLLEANQGQKSWSNPKGIYFRSEGMEPKGKTAALFPGQGSQYVNMGLELAINFSEFRTAYEKADMLVASGGRDPLTRAVYPIPVFSDEERKAQQENLTATENAQPAIGTFSMGLFQMLRSAGFQADFFAGHSFGELTALWAGGVLDDDAYIHLAVARGEAMGTPFDSGKDTGSMAAVKGNLDIVRELVQDHPEVIVANFNSPTQAVLAGSTQGIREIQPVLEKAGLTVYPLNVSAAFHTKFVEHAKEPFSKAIKKEKFQSAKGKVFSNSTAQQYPVDAAEAVQLLSDHILNPVRFQEEIENIYQAGGRIFVEIGPKNVLTNLVKDILGDQPHETITLNPNAKGDSDMQFRQAVLQMRVLGFPLENIDPYRAAMKDQPSTPSKVAVALNGGLYTTEATKQKFEQAIKDIPQKSQTRNTSVTPAPVISKSDKAGTAVTTQASVQTQTPVRYEATSMANTNEIEHLIEKLHAHQTGLLKAHEQFLQNDNVSKTLLQQVIEQEISLLAGKNGNPTNERAVVAIEKQAEFISGQHKATSSAHQAYIQSQADFTRQYAGLIQGLMQSGPVIEAATKSETTEIAAEKQQADFLSPVPVIIAAEPTETPVLPESSSIQKEITISDDQLSASFLAIVSEKTGYPVDMLELGMDMEADLGIDSIKRVEILGAMQEQYPELPTIEAEELVELRTLAQVIGAFESGSKNAVTSSPVQEFSASTNTDAKSPASAVSRVESNEIQTSFLEIVSEKTGYPVDMLELSMDMEADLGIDSIKRVEILGAVQEKYPELPAISAEELVDLRTLSQVVGAFTAEQPGLEHPVNVISPIVAEQKVATAEPLPQANASEVQTAFLEIVSEKTGYPTDMLELGMDMEADLGIDSIKRVEILGAVQEKYPDLPSINAEELVELRTLEQIIDRFNIGKQPVILIEQPATAEAHIKGANPIEVHPVSVQSLPKPDRIEFDFPENSMVLITANDADKANHLAKSFLEKGLAIGMIHLHPNGKSSSPAKANGYKHYTLENFSEDSIETLMQSILADHKKIIGFFHLEPSHNGKNNGPLDISDEGTQSLKTVFLMARHLKTPLMEAAADTRSTFVTVTQMDGQFGLNGYKAADPLPGGFGGLVKTLRQEWTQVFCRALDFHPDLDSQEVVGKIEEELFDADLRQSEVGYTPEGRFTLTLGEAR